MNKDNLPFHVKKVMSMVRWKMLEVLQNSNGISTRRKRSGWDMNPVSYLSTSSSSIFRYPTVASNVEKTVASACEAMYFAICGIGNELHFCTGLSLR